jgi:phosphohistidine swiveling domain-containing protein
MGKLPLNSKVEICRWGPIPGRFFYPSDFVDAIFFEFPKKYPGYAWPKTLFLFKGDRMVWLNEYPELRRAGKKNFIKYILPEKNRYKLRKDWQEDVWRLSVCENNIAKNNLSKLSDKTLADLMEKFYQLWIKFWLPTIPQELGNYGSDQLLEEKLKEIIASEEERSRAMEILTAPEELSFYQQEELDLQKSKNINNHQKKFFWLKNSYAGTQVPPLQFFAERKKELKPNLEQLLKVRIKQVKEKKLDVRNKYKLPPEIIKIAEALSEGVAWQDERKKYIFISLHYKEILLREVMKRKGYKFNDLLNCSTKEIIELAQGKDLKPIIKKRNNNFGFFCRPGRVEFLSRPETNRYWEIYAEDKVSGKISSIKGIVASSGRERIIQGRVKIVADPAKQIKFNQGDILVAPMTSPEYIFLMKKARAIITDTGGLTSHAAVVSRELNIPCIVGTKIATKIFKDGDLVEVDADKGIVKKNIKRV